MKFRLGGVEFSGESLSEELMVRDFDPGGADLRTNDSDRPNGDGVIPGRTFSGSTTWGWEITAHGNGVDGVLATNAKLAAAWKPKQFLIPAATVPLSYKFGSRWRRVYGRPGRYAPPKPDFIAANGIGHIACDFQITDPLYYSDVESSVVLTIVPASTGGLVAPLVAPLSTVRSSAPRVGLISNLGDSSTPLRVVFKGPIVDPYVRAAAGWEIRLTGSIAYDQSVTVDARAGTVTKNGSPVAGILSRSTRLSAARLPAGKSELTFGGTDLTGTATATVYWRDAYTSI